MTGITARLLRIISPTSHDNTLICRCFTLSQSHTIALSHYHSITVSKCHTVKILNLPIHEHISHIKLWAVIEVSDGSRNSKKMLSAFRRSVQNWLKQETWRHAATHVTSRSYTRDVTQLNTWRHAATHVTSRCYSRITHLVVGPRTPGKVGDTVTNLVRGAGLPIPPQNK